MRSLFGRTVWKITRSELRYITVPKNVKTNPEFRSQVVEAILGSMKHSPEKCQFLALNKEPIFGQELLEAGIAKLHVTQHGRHPKKQQETFGEFLDRVVVHKWCPNIHYRYDAIRPEGESWQDESTMNFIFMFWATEQNETMRKTLARVIQNTANEIRGFHGRVPHFLIVNDAEYKIMSAMAMTESIRHRIHQYQCFVDLEYIKKIDKFHLVKMVPRVDMFSEETGVPSRDHIIVMASLCSGCHRHVLYRVIPYFEQYVPGCGPELIIKMGYTMSTIFQELAPRDYRKIINILCKCPGLNLETLQYIMSDDARLQHIRKQTELNGDETTKIGLGTEGDDGADVAYALHVEDADTDVEDADIDDADVTDVEDADITDVDTILTDKG